MSATVRLRVELVQVGDQLRLRLREPGAVRVGRRDAQGEAPLPEQLGRVVGLPEVADARALVVGVDPAVARDADADARVVRPLVALHVEPQRAAVEAADHRLRVGGRRKALDEAGREVRVASRPAPTRAPAGWARRRSTPAPRAARRRTDRRPAACARGAAEDAAPKTAIATKVELKKVAEELFGLRALIVGIVVLSVDHERVGQRAVRTGSAGARAAPPRSAPRSPSPCRRRPSSWTRRCPST